MAGVCKSFKSSSKLTVGPFLCLSTWFLIIPCAVRFNLKSKLKIFALFFKSPSVTNTSPTATWYIGTVTGLNWSPKTPQAFSALEQSDRRWWKSSLFAPFGALFCTSIPFFGWISFYFSLCRQHATFRLMLYSVCVIWKIDILQRLNITLNRYFLKTNLIVICQPTAHPCMPCNEVNTDLWLINRSHHEQTHFHAFFIVTVNCWEGEKDECVRTIINAWFAIKDVATMQFSPSCMCIPTLKRARIIQA